MGEKLLIGKLLFFDDRKKIFVKAVFSYNRWPRGRKYGKFLDEDQDAESI